MLVLGAMSYSLYLLHARLQFLSMQLLRQVVRPDTLMFDVATIVVTCMFCYAFYCVCERPFMTARSSRSGKLIVDNPMPALAAQGAWPYSRRAIYRRTEAVRSVAGSR